MYDPEDIGYVDTYETDLKNIFKKVSNVINKYNATTKDRQLAVTVYKGNKRYAEVNVVDAVYNDVVLLTAFHTKINKTTGKFIVPLDATINEDTMLRLIEAKLSFGMFYIFIKEKES